MRVLEVSLRKAGYSVTTSGDVDGALELTELTEPDMILSDTRLPGKDGFALVAALKARPKWAEIPLMFLSSDPSVESRMRGLELGVEDYLTKPVYIREILTRVNLVMQRKEREGLSRTSKTRFSGALSDMGLVDLLQTIDVSRKSGTLHLTLHDKSGFVYFQDGRVLDAELGDLSAEAAIYRFLLWNEGEFELDFREVKREDKLGISTQGLLMEGMRRLDEWSRLQEQLPSLQTVFEVNHDELSHRLSEIPDEINEVLRLFDGRRTLAWVLEESVGDDLATLNSINKLYFEGFLLVRETPAPEDTDAQDLLIGALQEPMSEADAEALLPVTGGAASSPGMAAASAEGAVQAPRESGEPMEFAPLQSVPVHGEVPRQAVAVGNHAQESVSDVQAGVKEAVGMPLAAVKLKRISVPTGVPVLSPAATSAEAEPSSPAPTTEENLKTESEVRDLQTDPGEAAPGEDGGDEMARAAKRTQAERVSSERPRAPQPQLAASNVIALPTARAESAPSALSKKQKRKQKREQSAAKPSQPATAQATPAKAGAVTARDAEADADVNEERFFSEPPRTPILPQWHDLEPVEADAATQRQRKRGQLGTLGVLVLGSIAIGGFLFYSKVLMPTPADLPAVPLAIPSPDMLRASPPEVAASPSLGASLASAQAPSEQGSTDPSPVGEQKNSAKTEGSASAEDPEAAFEPLPVAEANPARTVTESDAEGYKTLLERARKQGVRKSAESSYQQALTIHPTGSEALSGLAMLYLNQGKNPQARDRAREAVRADPGNSEGWIVLGAAYTGLGDAASARAAYAKCAALSGGKFVAECRRMVR